MPRSLQRVVYRSSSKIPHDDEGGLQAIFLTSIKNNRRDAITGALALPDGHFVQVIEGRRGVVENLMTRLSADDRHSDIHILGTWSISARLFNGWAMAHPDTTPLDEQTFRIITQSGSGAQVVGLLVSLVKDPDVAMF